MSSPAASGGDGRRPLQERVNAEAIGKDVTWWDAELGALADCHRRAGLRAPLLRACRDNVVPCDADQLAWRQEGRRRAGERTGRCQGSEKQRKAQAAAHTCQCATGVERA